MIGLFQPGIGDPLSGHPITNRLVMAVNFAKTDGIATLAGIPPIPEDTGIAGPGSYVSANVTYTQGINRYGKWAGFSGASINSKFDWSRSDFVPTSGGCTIFMLYEKGDGSNRASSAFCVNISSGGSGRDSFCEALVPYSDGTVYWDFGGSSNGSTRLAIGGLSFGADRWFFTTGSRGMETWQNGIKRGSNGGNPSRTGTPTTGFVLGAKTADSQFSDVAHYNIFCMWARQLTVDEILMLNANPYMLWEPSDLLTQSAAAAVKSDYYRSRQLVMA